MLLYSIFVSPEFHGGEPRFKGNIRGGGYFKALLKAILGNFGLFWFILGLKGFLRAF